MPDNRHNSQDKVNEIVDASKSWLVKIDIREVKDVFYVHNGITPIHCMIPLQEEAEYNKNPLIYVEAGSQHGMLSLLDLYQKPGRSDYTLPRHHSMDGKHDLYAFYDRDPDTRKIKRIYLQEPDILRTAFCGTFEDVLKMPNIKGTWDEIQNEIKKEAKGTNLSQLLLL